MGVSNAHPVAILCVFVPRILLLAGSVVDVI